MTESPIRDGQAVSTSNDDSPARRQPRAEFAVFAVVTAGGGWLFVALDHVTGAAVGTGNATSAGGTTGQGLWILVPALTGLALGLRRGRSHTPFGLTLRFAHRWRWFAVALGFPVAATLVMVTAGVLTGTATFHGAQGPGKPPLLDGAVAVAGFLVGKNVLEELIFRGFGTPRAVALGLRGVWPHLLVGLVWGLWHLPLYLVWMSATDYRATTTLPKASYLPLFLLGTLALAVALGELRIHTGSIWPGVLLHTAGGVIAAPLLINGHLQLTGSGDVLFSPNANSLASTLLFGCAGLLLLRRRHRAEQSP